MDDLQPPPAGTLNALTARELEVTRLVMLAMTDQEIAARLDVSPRTVHTHVANAVRKTGVRNRLALAVLAVRSDAFAPSEDQGGSAE